jgi:hypothetical protein
LNFFSFSLAFGEFWLEKRYLSGTNPLPLKRGRNLAQLFSGTKQQARKNKDNQQATQQQATS